MTEEVIEVQQEEIPAQVEEAPEVESQAEPETKPEPPKEEATPKGVQRRIDRAVRQKYEAEARAKMLEERLSALERESRPVHKPTEGAPKLEDFDNFDDYIDAKADYVATKKINETLTEREKRQQAEQAQAAQVRTVEGWNKRVASATAEMPDFHDVVSNADVPLSRPMAEVIMASDAGPKLAYYLATHQDEAEDISAMPPIAAIRALTRIEDKLAAETAKASKAPPPVNPVGTKAKAERNPDDMPVDEWLKWRNKQANTR